MGSSASKDVRGLGSWHSSFSPRSWNSVIKRLLRRLRCLINATRKRQAVCSATASLWRSGRAALTSHSKKQSSAKSARYFTYRGICLERSILSAAICWRTANARSSWLRCQAQEFSNATGRMSAEQKVVHRWFTAGSSFREERNALESTSLWNNARSPFIRTYTALFCAGVLVEGHPGA